MKFVWFVAKKIVIHVIGSHEILSFVFSENRQLKYGRQHDRKHCPDKV
jgi:hypothetical protein